MSLNKPGIYSIANTITGAVYIGSAVSLSSRLPHHKRTLKAGTHHNVHLQRAWDKYGENSFVFNVVEFVADPSVLIEREDYHMQRCRSEGVKLYNIRPEASSPLGLVRSEESKRKQSETNKERFRQPGVLEEHKRRIAAGWTEEKRNMVRERKKGTKVVDMTENMRNKLSVASLNAWSDEDKRATMLSGLRNRDSTYIIERNKANAKVYAGVVSPDGTIYPEIHNLCAFCKEHGLDNGAMDRLVKGKQKKHLGWTMYKGEG